MGILDMRLSWVAFSAALSFMAAPAAADVVTFEGLTNPVPSVGFGNDGLQLYADPAFSSFSSEGGNTFLRTNRLDFAASGSDIPTQCCTIWLHSFDFRAARPEDVGQTFYLWRPFTTEQIEFVATADWSVVDFGTQPVAFFGWIMPRTPGAGDPPLFDIDNISFQIVAGIPEPATWAMMILGFGMAGASLRQRAWRIATPSV